MEQCLINNKVCAVKGQRCKNCKLDDDCREVVKMIETQEQREENFKIKCIKAQLPEQCCDCSFLNITDLLKQKVYCPYRVNDKCLIK